MGKDPEDKVKEFLDPMSDNFMGTGMSMQELLLTGEAERIQSGFGRQSKEERRRRLDLIIRLSSELVKVRAETQFAVRMGETAIEDLIEGDRSGLASFVGLFEMDDMPPGEHRDRMLPIWAGFARTIREALAGWPPDEEDPNPTKH